MKYSNLSSEVQNHCKQCGKEIYKKRDNTFCNSSCAASFTNKKEPLQKTCPKCLNLFFVPPHLKNKKYCSRACYLNQEKEKTEIICGFCEKSFLRLTNIAKHHKNPKTGKSFCSKSCRSKYIHANCNPTKNVIQSIPQQVLFDLLKESFPALDYLYNDRTILPSTLELDIVIPSLKIAIEVNGPTHYMPIFGQTKLEDVKLRDNSKFAEAHVLGYSLFIIDVSKLQKRDNAKFMKEQIEKYIGPVIREKMVGHDGTSPSSTS